MLNVLMQPNMPNMNAVNAAGNANPNADINPLFTKGVQGNQNSIDSGDFIAILGAIISGLNNSMMNAQNGLVINKDGRPVSIDELAMNLLAGNEDGPAVDGGLLGVLQQLISQAGIPNAVIPDNQQPLNQPPVNEMSNTILQSHNGNVVLTSLMKSEDGMQKIKVHSNNNIPADMPAGNNADNDSGLFDIKIMTKQDNEQPIHLSLKDIKPQVSADNVPKNQIQPNFLDVVSKGVKNGSEAALQLQIVSVEAEGFEKPAQEQPHEGDHSVISAIHNSGDKPSVSNASSVKEPLHVSRLHELAEPIAKTLGAGDKQLIIKLDPPDLGSIRIKLTMDNGVLKVDFKVESTAVKDMFSTAMPGIRASLEDSGIKLSEFFVDVKQDRSQDEEGRQRADSGQQQQKQQKEQQKEQKFKFYDYFA